MTDFANFRVGQTIVLCRLSCLLPGETGILRLLTKTAKYMARPDSLQGSLPVMVLKILLRRGPLHGYGITAVIESMSDDVLQVEEGSLYPALHRMEEARWIKAPHGRGEVDQGAVGHHGKQAAGAAVRNHRPRQKAVGRGRGALEKCGHGCGARPAAGVGGKDVLVVSNR
ncbi:hypothetical protein SBA3_360011 [Candidatus Sulfopaludibacter sp. SbA3]|nr:hypothetical protein SBA3_360011 [Candidatus Sulfopaludibacter sp. SbA3]